jgi:hypothetical protein
MASDEEPDWLTLCGEFRIFSARTLSHMTTFERFRALNERGVWMGSDDQPLALLFLSHRWDDSVHPDPSGLQLRTLQRLVMQICVVIRALFAEREQRLRLVPELGTEGTLQAEELARRLLGYGPFSGGNSGRSGNESRAAITSKVRTLEPEAFDRWLLGQIGLWVDYCCVPQPPRSAAEEVEFDQTLLRLNGLLLSSTVVALRRAGDDYDERAWCVSEIWLSAKRSFARSLFVDMDRVQRNLPAIIPSPPSSTHPTAGDILKGGYDADLEAFEMALGRWETAKEPLDYAPPDAWSAYRSLQGSGTLEAGNDPNPSRGGIELMRCLATELIRRWWWSQSDVTLNLTELIDQLADRHGLRATNPSDRIYLGLLLSSQGWLTALRPLFHDCLEAFLENRGPLLVNLEPTTADLRAALASVRPNSPDTWFSRLASQTGHSTDERSAIEALQRALDLNPLEWRVVRNVACSPS